MNHLMNTRSVASDAAHQADEAENGFVVILGLFAVALLSVLFLGSGADTSGGSLAIQVAFLR